MDNKSSKKAIDQLKKSLKQRYGVQIKLFLFGSVARNDYDADSDIDILVIYPGVIDTRLEEEIFDLAYDIELAYDVVFGIVIRSAEFWSSAKAAIMPFYQNIQKEAIAL